MQNSYSNQTMTPEVRFSTDAGIILSQANISKTSKESLIKYDIVKATLESFLGIFGASDTSSKIKND